MTQSIKTTFLLLFWSVCLLGQDFSTTLTNNHQLINGTNIYMIPPTSFELSSNFKGFQNPDDQTSMLMIMEIPGPFSEIATGFDEEMLQSRGMDLKQKSNIKIASFDGLLLELNQYANGLEFSKHILIFGNESSTTLINGVYLQDSTSLGKQLKESILTTFIDTETQVNPREALSYTLNEEVGGLQFFSVVGNGMLFNRDLKTPTESEDKVMLLTDKSFAPVEIMDKKQFCIQRVANFPNDFSVNEAKEIKAVELDGLKGYELYAQNSDDPAEQMYQLILFEEAGGYFLFVGTYLTGYEAALADIQRIIQTFKRK